MVISFLGKSFSAALPIPNGFWEMGGLSKDELVSRLARHTEGAADPARHDFTGTWQAAPAVPGQQPRWQLKISCALGVVSGTITNAKGFVRDTAIEQISLTGNELRFVFRSAKDGHYMFAKAVLADGMMKMNLAGIQDPFGDLELRKESK